MEIKIDCNGKKYGMEILDECASELKDTGDIVKIVEAAMSKDNEFRLGLTNIIVTGIMNGLTQLTKLLLESNEKQQFTKEQLAKMIRMASCNYNNCEELIDNANDSIAAMEEGKVNSFEIAGIKVTGYNPETKMFSIAA